MIRTARIATASMAATALLVSGCGSDSSKSKTSAGASGGGASSSTSSSTSPSASASTATGAKSTVASKLIFAGPPEFKTRPDGIPGLQQNYGVTFQSFKTTDTGGPVTVTALKNRQVDAADLFTTDPAIKANKFVVLTDPKNNFRAQNVLPLVNKKKATAGVKKVLDFVSSKITTADLINFNTKVTVDKADPDATARAFVQSLKAPTGAAKGASLVVGSANFNENVVLADIYADALQAAGAKITKKLNIGSRETYIPALKDGSIDLIPEYSGVLLQYFDKASTASSAAAVFAALPKALPASLTVLSQSSAEDRDAIVVTAQTAQKYGLTSIADLAKSAG